MRQKKTQDDLQIVADAFSGGAAGEDLLRRLASSLSRALDFDCVLIGQLAGHAGDSIETLAFSAHGRMLVDTTYCLANTPCANVISGASFCIYPAHVQKTFPEDDQLKEMGIEAYVGTPLIDSLGRVLGLMAALDSKPLREVERARNFFRIFAARASLEVERMRLDRHVLRDVTGSL